MAKSPLRRTVSFITTLAFLLLVTAGCAVPAQEPSKITSLRVVLDGEPDHLDYFTSAARIGRTTTDPIHATLITWDEKMQIKPYLAQKWEIVDTTTLKFTLVQGAKFHNGREVVAEDVKKTIAWVKDANNGSFLRTQLQPVSAVDVLDTYTVQLKLTAPFAPILPVLTGMPIFPAEAAGEMKTRPIGAGPFKFVRWDKGQQVVLERNADFFLKGYPKLDKLEFKFIAEYNSAVSALETGAADAVLYINPVDIPRLQQKKDLAVVSTPLMGYQFVVFETTKSPWANKTLRQAAALAMDRKAIIQKVENGLATPVVVAIPKGDLLYPSVADPERNLERAKQMAAQANVTQPLVLLAPNTPTEGPLGEVVQAQLKEAGINVELQKLDVPTFVDRVITKRDYGAAILGSTANGDPDDILYRYYHSQGTTNIHGLKNPDVDKALTTARQNFDPNTRKQAYQAFTQILLDEAPLIYLYQAGRHSALRSNVSGVGFRSNLTYDWLNAALVPGK